MSGDPIVPPKMLSAAVAAAEFRPSSFPLRRQSLLVSETCQRMFQVYIKLMFGPLIMEDLSLSYHDVYTTQQRLF